MQPRQAHSQWPLLVSGWHRPTHAVATPCLSHMLSCWAPETTVYFRPSKDTRRRTPVEGHPPRLPRLLPPPQPPPPSRPLPPPTTPGILPGEVSLQQGI